ncbi:MAG TPA: SPOR domain-containing protein, partial [Usitatibacter sp.]|nr:SPOR domain-containing protein [Usitatibacter sp.]
APPLPTPPAATKAPAAEVGKSAPQPPEVARQPRTDPKVAESKVLESRPPAPPKPPPAVVASAAPAPAPGTAAPGKATPGQAASGAQSTPRLEGFAVQVGAFRDESTLAQAREKLAAAKVPHYTERMEAKSGPLTRLRAGPFKTREAAESALAQLKLSALDGKVVPLP